MSISRVSTYQVNKSFSNQLNNTQAKYNQLTQQISSGVKVSSTMDDPVAARGIIKANKALGNIEEYKNNIEQADIELSEIDGTLKSINDQLSKAYDVAMQISNGTMGSDQLIAYQEELDSIIDNVTRLANTQYNDQYIFSGTRTTTIPYAESDDGMIYAGNSEKRYAIIGDNKTEEINLIGNELFGSAAYTKDADGNIIFDEANSSGVFGALYQLKSAIQDADNIDEDAVKSAMGGIDNGINTITAGKTKVGAVGSSFDDMLTSYENDSSNLVELRSNLQDTDLPSAISNWYSSYQAMQASYSMMAQTMNVSLLNYI